MIFINSIISQNNNLAIFLSCSYSLRVTKSILTRWHKKSNCIIRPLPKLLKRMLKNELLQLIFQSLNVKVGQLDKRKIDNKA